MNTIGKSRIVKFSSIALALLTTVLLVSGGAWARERKVKESANQACVVAHISLSGLSAVDLAMVRKANGKYYLYVQHPRDQGISIIDISKPAQPKAVAVIPWPDPAVSSRMNVTGDLAIIAESEVLPRHNSTTHDDLVLWDLSDPAVPRVVQRFAGVIKWMQDERNFIYVLNSDGLWVVSDLADRQPEQIESSPSYGG